MKLIIGTFTLYFVTETMMLLRARNTLFCT